MRVIALTGVPGTGKTAIAHHVSGVEIVDANALARQADAIEGEDEQRGAAVVDEQRLAQASQELLSSEGPLLVEGHLSHHCATDAVILLRCHPDELRRRLQQRDWSSAKIEENVMAETLDALVPEIQTRPAAELDTTDREAADLAKRVEELFTGETLEADWLDPLGTADWTHTITGGDEG